MTNDKNIFHNVLEYLGHPNITTSSILVFFQSSHYTYILYMYCWIHFSWASTFWLPACLDLRPYNSKSSEKKSFPFPTTQGKSSVLISIEQNWIPCLFLNTIHRGQLDIMPWFANPEFHAQPQMDPERGTVIPQEHLNTVQIRKGNGYWAAKQQTK